MTTDLATVTPTPTALDVPALMQAIVAQGIKPESVAVMKDMLAMHRELQHDQAKAAFARAFAAMQNDLRPVQAVRAIPGQGGKVRSTFASFADIMAEVGPILSQHGFSVSFGQKIDANRTVAVCTLMHAEGHERTGEFAVRNGSGAPGNSDAQNDGGAMTFAKRYALCGLLNIVIDHDNDARAEGDTIDPGDADKLDQRVQALCGNDPAKIARWKKLVGADSFAQVRTGKLGPLIATIEAEEAKQAPAAKPEPKQPAMTVPDLSDPAEFKATMDGVFHDRGFTPAQMNACFKGWYDTSKITSFLASTVAQRESFYRAVKSGKADKFKS